MANTYIGDVCFSTGEYEKNGEKKKRWTKAGAMFKSDEYGTITIKFEALPAGPDWSGYMRLFPAKKHDDHQSNDVAPSDIDDKPIDLTEIPF